MKQKDLLLAGVAALAAYYLLNRGSTGPSVAVATPPLTSPTQGGGANAANGYIPPNVLYGLTAIPGAASNLLAI